MQVKTTTSVKSVASSCVSVNNTVAKALSLVFVFKVISTFIGQNPKIFYAYVEKGCSASLTMAREKQP